MMDLVIAMTPYVDENNIKILYGMALPWLQVCICFPMNLASLNFQKTKYRQRNIVAVSLLLYFENIS